MAALLSAQTLSLALVRNVNGTSRALLDLAALPVQTITAVDSICGEIFFEQDVSVFLHGRSAEAGDIDQLGLCDASKHGYLNALVCLVDEGNLKPVFRQVVLPG